MIRIAALIVLVLTVGGLVTLLVISDQLTQPIATLFAAFLMPTLGFVGFRYQKMLDREAEAIAQRRKVYLELIDIVHAFDKEHTLKNEGQLWDYHKIRDKIFLLAPDLIAETLQMHRLGITYFARTKTSDDCFDEMREAHDAAFFKLLDVMRTDLDSSAKFVPSSTRKE